MRMGLGDRGLARRGRPVCLWVAVMQDGHVLGRRCPPLMLPEGSGWWWPLGGSSSVGTVNPVGSDGPVVTGSPIGPCETLSPLFQSALEPLEHSVPEVILERSSRRKLSALEPLDHSVPDEILEHSSRKKFVRSGTIRAFSPRSNPGAQSGLDQAGPVGRQFAYVARRSRPVVAAGGSSSVGTANPVGSDGPVVTGSPIGPCETLSPFFSPLWNR